MRERLLNHLRTFFGEDFDDRVTVLEDSRTTEGGGKGRYDSLPVLTLKVATFYLRGVERHLLVTTATCAYELVEAFDISTHAVAIEPDGNVVKASTWTQVTLPPTMIRDTPTTRERMVKIAKRYGLYAPLAELEVNPFGDNDDEDNIPF
jgi:sulfur carrier protein ThiS